MADREIMALVIHRDDDVATVTEEVKKGDHVVYSFSDKEKYHVRAAADIPKFHKIAIKPVHKGKGVIKYGEEIGTATAYISVGDHVHVQNVIDMMKEDGHEDECI